VPTFKFADYELDLEVNDEVFTPTSTTNKLAQHLEINSGDKVLDLGCGIGPMAIIAALMGAGHVHAVDIVADACELARRNVAKAGVEDRVTVTCGDLFEPVRGETFDVIIDDVSGMADRVARISPWFPPQVPTGGTDGTDVTMRMLEEAPNFLRPGGRLYFPVLSLSRAGRIRERARELYENALECLGSYRIPFCRELVEASQEMQQMRQEGVIDFEPRGSRFIWDLEIYRAHV